MNRIGIQAMVVFCRYWEEDWVYLIIDDISAVSHDTLPYNPTVVVGYSWLLYDIMLLSICVSQCYPYYETCG